MADVVGALGGGLLRIVVAQPGPDVDDLTLAEPSDGVFGQAGDLLLGVGVASTTAAGELLEAASRVGSGAVVLRRATARHRSVRSAARRFGITLVELADHASWAHVVWLLRGVLDQAASGAEMLSDGPIHDELFSLADACAALVDAPVTIEDTQSRVLAHSSRQDVADPIRLSTIVGRKVPDAVLASLRGRGVFRRLARSDEPVYVPADGDLRPRLVIPVRAGTEWLGSIWIVVESRPDAALVRSLRQTASVVALHLLRLRSQTDLSRRVAADRLRAALTGQTEGVEAWLPAGPWRVVVLDGGPTATTAATRADSPGHEMETRVDLWESAARRRSWRQPLLAVHDGVVLALVTDPPATTTSPGTWGWLQAVVDEVAAATTAGNAPATASAGAIAMRPVELNRSRGEALEVHRLRDSGRVSATTRTLEQAWAAVTTARCVAALRVEEIVGPVRDIAAHDAAHDTAYAETIAAWLDHPGDPRSAAAGIHVHPNTLRYRLQRLSEIVELDLHDPETRLAVRLQLRALGH